MAGLFTNTLAYEMADRLSKINQTVAFSFVFDNEDAKNLIIEMNTNDQLYEKGIDSKGNPLGDYSDFTTLEKIKKGQRFDHITLKDTGDFYESFRVVVLSRTLVITAQGQKDDNNLFVEYGEDVLGLTDDNLQRLINFALERYIEYLWKKICP